MKKPIRVAITGAAGQIGYSLVFRIASGSMFGPDQPVILQLIEIPQAEKALEGVVMELEDCAFPLLEGIVATSDLAKGFDDADWALLVGSVPRKQGMERKDLIGINGKIFISQGKAIQDYGAQNVRTLVIGNPCNTNAWIAKSSAPDVPADQWFAMTRLDENRAKSQLANKAGLHVSTISNMAIWGNHSATQYPDFTHALVNGELAIDIIEDRNWLENDFIKTVQQRGAAIIQARGSSSAASAANAIVHTVRSLTIPTREGDWTSVAVSSDGSYGIEEGLMCSFPVRTTDGNSWEIVKDLKLDAFSQAKIDASVKELKEERDLALEILSTVAK